MTIVAFPNPASPRVQPAGREGRVVLGLGEWHVSADPAETLLCLGLGSCVALCAYDPIARVAGMAHMVLPDSSAARNGTGGPRFVDIAVPLVVEAMGALGAIRGRLRVQLAGGAHVLALQGDGHQIGGRNVEAAIRALARLHLHAKYDQTGGSRGRTVTLAVATGEVTIATAGAGAAAG